MILTYVWPWNMVKFIKPWYDLVDPKQDYNYAKFERPPFNSVRQQVNIKVTVKSENNYLRWKCVVWTRTANAQMTHIQVHNRKMCYVTKIHTIYHTVFDLI